MEPVVRRDTVVKLLPQDRDEWALLVVGLGIGMFVVNTVMKVPFGMFIGLLLMLVGAMMVPR